MEQRYDDTRRVWRLRRIRRYLDCPRPRKGPDVSVLEIAIWFAVSAFLVIRVAMLVAFIALPIVIVRMVHRQSTA